MAVAFTTARLRDILMIVALLLVLSLATGCAARATTSSDGTTTVEIDTRGGASTGPADLAPAGAASTAAAPIGASDASARSLFARIGDAIGAFDWRAVRQACADLQEHAKDRERSASFAPAKSAADKDGPAVAGVRERADAAFWNELER